MSAAVLREAAALMRTRAEAVDYPAPWVVGGGTCGIRSNGGRNYVASTYGGVGTEEAAAEHIASWHPVVALAVARWLEHVAHNWPTVNGGVQEDALSVARAYLGDDPHVSDEPTHSEFEFEDDEKFCPKCFAGLESSEHLAECSDGRP